jgi:hypothetical protein
MSRRLLRTVRSRLFAPVSHTKEFFERAIADAVRPFCWRPITTAPFNRNVKLRIAEADRVLTMPFPCRRTNDGRWINADLGTPVAIDPTHWCIWRRRTPSIRYRPSTRRQILQALRLRSRIRLSWAGSGPRGSAIKPDAAIEAAMMRLKTHRIVRQALLGNGFV